MLLMRPQNFLMMRELLALNANQVLMLHRRIKIIRTRAVQANKAALETEKERDELASFSLYHGLVV
jgi:hypothetical protein